MRKMATMIRQRGMDPPAHRDPPLSICSASLYYDHEESSVQNREDEKERFAVRVPSGRDPPASIRCSSIYYDHEESADLDGGVNEALAIAFYRAKARDAPAICRPIDEQQTSVSASPLSGATELEPPMEMIAVDPSYRPEVSVVSLAAFLNSFKSSIRAESIYYDLDESDEEEKVEEAKESSICQALMYPTDTPVSNETMIDLKKKVNEARAFYVAKARDTPTRHSPKDKQKAPLPRSPFAAASATAGPMEMIAIDPSHGPEVSMISLADFCKSFKSSILAESIYYDLDEPEEQKEEEEKESRICQALMQPTDSPVSNETMVDLKKKINEARAFYVAKAKDAPTKCRAQDVQQTSRSHFDTAPATAGPAPPVETIAVGPSHGPEVSMMSLAGFTKSCKSSIQAESIYYDLDESREQRREKKKESSFCQAPIQTAGPSMREEDPEALAVYLATVMSLRSYNEQSERPGTLREGDANFVSAPAPVGMIAVDPSHEPEVSKMSGFTKSFKASRRAQPLSDIVDIDEYLAALKPAPSPPLPHPSALLSNDVTDEVNVDSVRLKAPNPRLKVEQWRNHARSNKGLSIIDASLRDEINVDSMVRIEKVQAKRMKVLEAAERQDPVWPESVWGETPNYINTPRRHFRRCPRPPQKHRRVMPVIIFKTNFLSPKTTAQSGKNPKRRGLLSKLFGKKR